MGRRKSKKVQKAKPKKRLPNRFDCPSCDYPASVFIEKDILKCSNCGLHFDFKSQYQGNYKLKFTHPIDFYYAYLKVRNEGNAMGYNAMFIDEEQAEILNERSRFINGERALNYDEAEELRNADDIGDEDSDEDLDDEEEEEEEIVKGGLDQTRKDEIQKKEDNEFEDSLFDDL
eukprot:TRINITY_DN3215_c0_g1_i1.p1 TRINITY_DN3215_c0_g1~~TRINITY_DN3215_c0_g1_i1.p1  ORF type:complete len:174 (+),score=70.57 TRINITY_DN3215_c0_g1_i1:24-545(+)